MRSFLYVTNSRTGNVHVTTPFSNKTLCGLKCSGSAWLPGDETASGHAADCRACKGEARAIASHAAPLAV